jgi:large subunit ribosomal protein L25
MEVTIECQKRPEGSKPNALRRSGLIPAVLYGHNGTESVSLTLDAKDATTMLKQATINNTLVQVNIPDLPWKGKALLREVQTHPWKPLLYHISFFSVAAQETLDAEVPVHFVGEPVGVKQGGTLDPVLTMLSVRCAPGDIPESIEVDVSNLEIGASLHISDLPLPAGVTPLVEPESTVVSIAGVAPVETETATEAETETEATAETETATETEESA